MADHPGRGEFVRLALEEAAAPYEDVARLPGKGAGVEALTGLIAKCEHHKPPFAPPFLKAGRLDGIFRQYEELDQ